MSALASHWASLSSNQIALLRERAGRVDQSWALRRADAYGLGKRRAGVTRFGEALQDILAVRREPERDPAVEVNPLELKRVQRRVARRPPRIDQVLLWRARDGARSKQKAKRDDCRFQHRRSWPLGSFASLLDDLVSSQQN